MGISSKPPARGPAGAGLIDTADYLEPLRSSPEEAPSSTPHRIGRFVILRRLGQGGLGAVYAAYDEELDRKVAIKLLHQSEIAGADHRTLLLREAQAMARVSHPNVLHVYEVGEELGRVCIAMELIDGTTLTTWQRTRTWQEILRMYRAAGAGLLAAHRVGLVHRDFKPDNVPTERRRPIIDPQRCGVLANSDGAVSLGSADRFEGESLQPGWRLSGSGHQPVDNRVASGSIEPITQPIAGLLPSGQAKRRQRPTADRAPAPRSSASSSAARRRTQPAAAGSTAG